MTSTPPQRVSPIHAPEAYALPGRPENASATVLDAYRQTQFLLRGDLALFEAALNLQLGLLKDAYPSKYRTHTLAAIMSLWSRAFFCLSDAMLLTTRGSYASALPLVRAAAEIIAAEEGLRGGAHAEFSAWLSTTLVPDEDFKAFEFELGRYGALGIIDSDDVLRGVYRPAADLALPAFGATLLQVAPESNNNRLAIGFWDAAFHLGWAEIIVGWLLALAGRQLKVIVDASTGSAGTAEGVFPVSEERRAAYDDLQSRLTATLASDDRCRIEEVTAKGDRRYLVHNFRRSASGSPKKVVL